MTMTSLNSQDTGVVFFSFSFLILSTDNHLDRLGMHKATIKNNIDTSQWAPHRHKPCGSPSAYDKTTSD